MEKPERQVLTRTQHLVMTTKRTLSAVAGSVLALAGMASCSTDSQPSGQLPAAATAAVDTVAEKQALNALLVRYAHSINAADTVEAATVWRTSPDVSFIEPRGTEMGWQQVKNNFYAQVMGQTFTKRQLHIHPESIALHVYQGTAWAQFEWDFAATFRDSGKPVVTKGRETQILQKTAQGWRIVHVHYSGLPVTGAGQGF